MVWEQRSRGVVMLNRVIEKGSVSICFLLTATSCRDTPPVQLCPSLVEPAGQMRPVLASEGGGGQRLRGDQLQAHPRLRGRQILLHCPSAGAGEPDRECSDAATPAPPPPEIKKKIKPLHLI